VQNLLPRTGLTPSEEVYFATVTVHVYGSRHEVHQVEYPTLEPPEEEALEIDCHRWIKRTIVARSEDSIYRSHLGKLGVYTKKLVYTDYDETIEIPSRLVTRIGIVQLKYIEKFMLLIHYCDAAGRQRRLILGPKRGFLDVVREPTEASLLRFARKIVERIDRKIVNPDGGFDATRLQRNWWGTAALMAALGSLAMLLPHLPRGLFWMVEWGWVHPLNFVLAPLAMVLGIIGQNKDKLPWKAKWANYIGAVQTALLVMASAIAIVF